jgi:hypothetical protein
MVNIGDAPLAGVLSFEVTINSATLSGTGGTVNLISTPVRLEISSLAGTMRPLVLTSIPPGTYDTLAFTFSNAEVVFLKNGVPTKQEISTPSTATNVTISPAATASASGAVALNIDFKLGSSLSVDGAGNVSFTPVITAAATAVPAGGGQQVENGKIEDLRGMVLSVAAPQFTVATREKPAGVTFTTDVNTVFNGITGLSALVKGTIVEIDAATQSNGTLLAKKIEVEDDHENEAEQEEEAEGLVAQVTGTPATSITVVVNDSSSTTSAQQPAMGSTITVNINANTDFRVDNHVDLTGLNFAPTFSAATIAPGQKVEAESKAPSATSITARRLKLGIQAIDGTISNLVPNGTRSTFTLNLAPGSVLATLTGQTSITVFQQPGTEVKNVTVANGNAARVRGTLFFTGTAYNLVAQRITKQ